MNKPLTSLDIAEIKKLVKARVENYPDLERMLDEGKLAFKSGWYEAFDQTSRDSIIQYATAIRINKQGKAQFKLAKLNKKLKTLAAKL